MCRAVSRFERRFDVDWLDRQIDRRLICHEHRDLVDELLEDLRRRVAVAQNRQLVLNERMPDNCQRRKFWRLFDHSCHPSDRIIYGIICASAQHIFVSHR